VSPAAGTDVAATSTYGQEFGAFYAAELDQQVRRAYLIVGSTDTANDVVHDAFVAVYRRWGEIEDPGPYLNRAVLNGCRDVCRRRVRHDLWLHRLALRDQDQGPSTDDMLNDILEGLPFNHRAAIVLRYYAQFTTAEIAEALGCAPGSVGPWIGRALDQMRKALT
jgi:RNA polymerase sigma factor (sigma-70 family)